MKLIFRFIRAIYCWGTGGCKTFLNSEERMNICKKCEHYSKGKCVLCGCILSLKTKMDSESCPIHKW